MSANRPDISQIRKYLNGELDARAMYKLERQAQDDPFLMDMISGMESSSENHQPNLDAIDRLIKERISKKEKARVVPLYQYLSAACLLIALGIGGWWLTRTPNKIENIANHKIHVKRDNILVEKPAIIDTVTPNTKAGLIAKLNHKPTVNISINSNDMIIDPVSEANNIYRADTIDNRMAVNKPPVQADNVLKEVTIASPVTIESRVAGRMAGIDVTDNAKQVNERTVSGKVLDQQGAPLIGATVKVDGTGTGVATDVGGNFKIELPANKDLLAVNYVGYSPKQVKVGDQSNLNIALQADGNSLNEVVVTGFGTTTKKATLAGAISTIPANTRVSSLAQGSIACNENLKFKTQFFDHIAVAEKYTNENITATAHTVKTADFKEALAFLNKYTKVPANATDYKDLSAFRADKDQWLKWYEANKCNNLK